MFKAIKSNLNYIASVIRVLLKSPVKGFFDKNGVRLNTIDSWQKLVVTYARNPDDAQLNSLIFRETNGVWDKLKTLAFNFWYVVKCVFYILAHPTTTKFAWWLAPL